MGIRERLEDTKLEDLSPKGPNGESIKNPCHCGKTLITDGVEIAMPEHNAVPMFAPIFVIDESKRAVKVAEGITCAAGFWMDHNSKKRYVECWGTPYRLKRVHGAPKFGISAADFYRMAKHGPSYWHSWGWHFVQIKGIWRNLNELEDAARRAPSLAPEIQTSNGAENAYQPEPVELEEVPF